MENKDTGEKTQLEKLDKFLEANPHFKGKFMGYVHTNAPDLRWFSRINDGWYQCSEYFIRIDDLVEGMNEAIRLSKIEALQSLEKDFESLKKVITIRDKDIDSWHDLGSNGGINNCISILNSQITTLSNGE